VGARARSFAIAAVITMAAGSAHANGRFPYANQLLVDPGNADRIVVRTTYGILQTFDAGKTWNWLCEKSVGYGGTLDPALGVTKNGTTIAGIFDGLSVTRDRGCSWATSGAPLDKEYVIDVAVEANDPTHAVALTSTGLGSGGFHVIVAESLDDGKTWTQAGVDLPTDFNSETLDVAPSDTNRIYVSGIVGTPRAGFIERSDDRGKSWSRLGVDLAGTKAPFIAAIDPVDPNLLYVRLDGDPEDHVLVSADGGKSWKEIYKSTGDLLAFALSPDGSKLAIGGPKDGLLVASRTDYVFQKVQSAVGEAGKTLGPRCLTWSGPNLYVCASEYPDGFTVGVSVDDGKTFKAIHHLSDLSELKCGAATSTGSACPSLWASVQDSIGQERDAGADASHTGTRPGKTDSNCGCRLVAPRAYGSGAGSVAWLALLVTSRVCRRRSHRRRRQTHESGLTAERE